MTLRFVWNDEQAVMPITDELAARLDELLQLAAEQEGVAHGEVALTFVDDEAIHELNMQYRGIDRPTDVLTFAMSEMGENEMKIIYDDLEDESKSEEGSDDSPFVEPLGDIIISVPRAIAQSEEYGHSAERELGFLFVHGFFHLIGYDHGTEEDEKEMFGKQEAILQKAGLTR